MRLMPGRCRDDLYLDVPRVVQQRLGEQRRIAEAELRLRGALAVGVVDLIGAVHLPHSAAAAAGQRLDHDGAVLGGEERADVVDAARPFGRRQHRHPGRDRGGTGRGLVADPLEHVGVRAHERVPGRRAGAGEFGVLAEESVAGMNHLGAGIFGRRQYRRLVQVGVGAGAGQSDRFVGGVDVWAVGVVFGVDRDRLHTQFGCGADDSERDLAAVRDQQRRAHRSGSPHCTCSRSLPLSSLPPALRGSALVAMVTYCGNLEIGELRAAMFEHRSDIDVARRTAPRRPSPP